MHRARVQTGNPGFDTLGLGRSLTRSFSGSVILGFGIPFTGNPGFSHSHSDNYELPNLRKIEPGNDPAREQPNPRITELGNDRTREAWNPGSSEPENDRAPERPNPGSSGSVHV
jgi:hypothetical protein